jgi:hypothetical protein
VTTPTTPALVFPIDGGLVISKAAATNHLRLVLSSAQPEIEADLDLKMAQASEAIRRYLDRSNDPAWDATSAPACVQQAALLHLGCAWDHRGDTGAAPSGTTGPARDAWAGTWETIGYVLRQLRDSAIA